MVDGTTVGVDDGLPLGVADSIDVADAVVVDDVVETLAVSEVTAAGDLCSVAEGRHWLSLSKFVSSWGPLLDSL